MAHFLRKCPPKLQALKWEGFANLFLLFLASAVGCDARVTVSLPSVGSVESEEEEEGQQRLCNKSNEGALTSRKDGGQGQRRMRAERLMKRSWRKRSSKEAAGRRPHVISVRNIKKFIQF